MATPTHASVNAALDSITALAAGGRVTCHSADSTEIMFFNLASPAFFPAVSSEAEVIGIPIGFYVADGVIDHVHLETALGADLAFFTAGLPLSGADVEFDALTIDMFSLVFLDSFIVTGEGSAPGPGPGPG